MTTAPVEGSLSSEPLSATRERGVLRSFFEIFTGSPEVIALKDRLRRERDEARGYSVNVKQVVFAFIIEIVIIVASLIGAYHFALLNIPDVDPQSVNLSNSHFVLGMLGQVGFAMVEMTRIPLALSIRFQTSYLLKILAIIGVICAAGITAKSMVSLSQQLYEPRRAAVLKAKTELNFLTRQKELADQQYENLNEIINERKNRINEILSSQREMLNRANCVPGTFQKMVEGERLTIGACQNQSLMTSLQRAIEADLKTLVVARASLSNAEKEAASFFEVTVKKNEQERIKAEAKYREAIMNSQLHSLAAILLNKDTMEVEDADVSFLMKFFIYIPALLVAFASTMIAITAVTRLKKRDPAILMPADAQAYLLGPVTSAIIQRILEELRRTGAHNNTVIDESVRNVKSGG